MCRSVRVGRKNPKSEWWNDEVKGAIERKGATLKDVLGTNNCERRMYENL